MRRTTRYISAAENAPLCFPQPLALIHPHLKNEHNVVYPADASAETRASIVNSTASDLMRCRRRPTAPCFTGVTLLDYFETYVVIKRQKGVPSPTSAPVGKWLDQYLNLVSTRTAEHVCRIHFKSPAVGGVFCPRLLIHKVPARSFTELRTVRPEFGPSVIHPIFHVAARVVDGWLRVMRNTSSACERLFFPNGEFTPRFIGNAHSRWWPCPKLWHDFQDSLLEDMRMLCP